MSRNGPVSAENDKFKVGTLIGQNTEIREKNCPLRVLNLAWGLTCEDVCKKRFPGRFFTLKTWPKSGKSMKAFVDVFLGK